MRIGEALGPLFEDEAFAGAFAVRGRPAVSPGALALVSVLQYAEGLTDRQAADQVRARMDWKLLLGLEQDDPGFEASVLSLFRSLLPAAHPLAGRRSIHLTDLADEPWVGSEWPGPCLEAQLAACATAGFQPRFVVDSEDYATAQGFVAAGLGVTLIPRLGLGGRHPDVAVRQLRGPEPARAIYAAVRQTALPQPALAAFVEALREAAAG